MAPCQLFELRRMHRFEKDRQEYLVGIIASSIINYGFKTVRKPARPADFMSHPPVEPSVSDEQLAEKIAATLAAIAVPAG